MAERGSWRSVGRVFGLGKGNGEWFKYREREKSKGGISGRGEIERVFWRETEGKERKTVGKEERVICE